MRVKIEIFPNREIRTCVSSDARIRKEKVSSKQTSGSDAPGVFSCDETHEADGETRPPLDISCDFTKTLKPGYGGSPRKTEFGLRAKRTLQRVGGVFDRMFSPSECVFLTGTLPGSGEDAMKAIADWSGYIVKCVKDWIKYYVGTEYSFHCWEFQRRGALHLHYCVAINDCGSRESVIERFKLEWIRILESVSEKSGIDLFRKKGFGSWRGNKKVVQAYAQRVRKSVAAYLAKYCSKEHDTSLATNYPSRWWGCSRAALHALERMTLTLELDSVSIRKALAMYEDVIHITESVSKKSYEYVHGSGYGISQVAYYCPEENPEDIWRTLIRTLGSFSMRFSAKKGNREVSAVKMFETLHSSLSANSSGVCLSVPAKEALMSIISGQRCPSRLTLSDWREMYSIACYLCSRSSSDISIRRVRGYLRQEMMRMQSYEITESIRPAK